MAHLRLILWVLTAIYWVGIFVLTHLPPDHQVRPPATLGDKAMHFLAYLGLSLALGLALVASFPRRGGLLWLVLAAGLAYGAADEWSQLLVGRDCELFDWLADAAGVMLAVLLLSVLRRAIVARISPTDAPATPRRSEPSAL